MMTLLDKSWRLFVYALRDLEEVVRLAVCHVRGHQEPQLLVEENTYLRLVCPRCGREL